MTPNLRLFPKWPKARSLLPLPAQRGEGRGEGPEFQSPVLFNASLASIFLVPLLVFFGALSSQAQYPNVSREIAAEAQAKQSAADKR